MPVSGCPIEGNLLISRFSAWAPGFADPLAWDEWAEGSRDILAVKDGPDLAFTEPRFRRRLSQISRMTIQVLWELLPLKEDTKVVFLSFRGEITQQFKINKMLIEERAVLPAAFSLSVFNAPPALAAMVLGLSAGYTAVYPADGFRSALLLAAAPVLSGSAEETALVYADELCPPDYGDLCPPDNKPLAFAAVLSGAAAAGGPGEPAIPFPPAAAEGVVDSPREFLKYLLRYRKSRSNEREKTGA
jgi:hypothetical protein